MAAVSIIIPVYRAEHRLEQCVGSILRQDFRDFEVILVDDGSPDGSGVLCDALAAREVRRRTGLFLSRLRQHGCGRDFGKLLRIVLYF